MMVLTGDDHGQPLGNFTSLISNVESRGGHISLYAPRWAANPTASDAVAWRAAGHEIGLHPYGYMDSATLQQGFVTNESWFAQQNRGTPSRTTRMHQVEWQGWVDAAAVEAAHGMGMDTTFYTWGPSIQKTDGSHAQGYITGSSLPLRFVGQNGTLLSVYQQATTLIDESMMASLGANSSNYTAAEALAVTHQIIDASQAGDYAALMTQFHVDYYTFGDVNPWANGTMDYAASLGIPMWTAEHWLTYVEARSATTVSNLSWSPASTTLSFQVVVPASSDAQTVMLPSTYGGQSIGAVNVNGAPASVTTQQITGRTMSFISLPAGTHNIVVSYNQAIPPATSTPVAPTNTPTATSTNTPVPATATATSVPSNDLAHTTQADFQASCAVPTDTRTGHRRRRRGGGP